MSLENFIESLDNVPPELERNFNLITELDQKISEMMERIDELAKGYKASTKARRSSIRKETEDLFDKIDSISEHKFQLANSTYELIDKNVDKLITMAERNDKVSTALRSDMPLDPNEPKYCICHGVSSGQMVACDNLECQIEWFHYVCVNLTESPKGKWYCPNCAPTILKRRPKSRRSNRY